MFEWGLEDSVSTCAEAVFTSASTYIIPVVLVAGVVWPRAHVFHPIAVATMAVGSICLIRFAVESRCDTTAYLSSLVAHAVPVTLTSWRRRLAEAADARTSLLLSLWVIYVIVALFHAFDVWTYPISPIEFIGFALSSGLLAHATG